MTSAIPAPPEGHSAVSDQPVWQQRGLGFRFYLLAVLKSTGLSGPLQRAEKLLQRKQLVPL